ncbi:MAG: hypothetical protein QM714_15845 [Nocardioides sp.]|uniref:hypothetical protein n=1 Tax=Nocardioides sp. TaxID=35761 RepID=UPI0039E55EB4
MSTTDALWGGQLKAVGFDPVVHSLTLQIDVIDGGVSTTYDLECSGVSGLRFTNSIPDPWTYAEVTEVHTGQTTAGQWTVELVLWSEDCELVCTCDAFVVIEHS